MSLLLGVDIGGTKIAAGIVDSQTGALLRAERIPTNPQDGGASVLQRAVLLAAELRDAAEAEFSRKVVAAGIGAGGQIHPISGDVVHATDLLPGWRGQPLAGALRSRLAIPVKADNDVNALAVGELRFGAARGHPNVLVLALGTGVGGAVIVDGRLYRGTTGAAGELGHLIVEPQGRKCTCGGLGCLEQYASGPGLVATFVELGGAPGISAEEIGERSASVVALTDTDRIARDAVAATGRHLGIGLVSLLNCFAPDAVVLGGGVSEIGAPLVDAALNVVGSRALPALRQTPVLAATLGSKASLVGAAALAFEILEDSSRV